MKNECNVIIPTDVEMTTAENATGIGGNYTTSPEKRGVAVKKTASMKDIFFGDIDWKECGRALTSDVSFEGFRRVMTSDVDFGAIKTALFSPIPDKSVNLGEVIKSLFTTQVRF